MVADRRVDAILDALSGRRDIEGDTEELKRLGPAAVPRLLHHLRQGDRRVRSLAFYGLQYCWSPAAEAAVADHLADDDAGMRQMAAIVLVKGAGYERFVDRLLPLLDDARPEVAAFALGHVEAERPDRDRTRRLLERPELWPALAPHLCRYHDPALRPALLAMLRDGAPELLEPVLAALVHVNADDTEARAAVAARLAHPEAAVRDAAAVWFLWHGTEADRVTLRARRAAEAGWRTAAVLDAALAAIDRRAGRPGTAADRRAWRDGEAMEPHWAYRGRDPDAAFVAARAARLRLQAELFAIPGRPAEWRLPAGIPPARCCVAPVRGYFTGGASNYGKEVEDSAVKGFGGLVHVGDDVAWNRPLAPVAAIADGVVRGIGCTATWGTMVIIEHAEADGGAFCSLYAHLSPFVTVAAGETVAAGRMIGAVGRPFTWENGGYAAHLHFALHEGPFVQTPRPGTVIDLRWQGRQRRGLVMAADDERTICRILDTPWTWRDVTLATAWPRGYVSKWWWDEGDHGWLEPRGFLRRRGAAD